MKALKVSIWLLAASCLISQIGLAQNAVTDWAGIIQPAILGTDAGTPRPPASSQVLHATVQLAVYNAVMAIKGGYQFYGPSIAASRGADVRAAVATAAHHTARARVDSSQVGSLDTQYKTYMDAIPGGHAKDEGVKVGEAAAAAILMLRANDGFNNLVIYECSSIPPPPGEFEPNAGCGTQPVDAKLAQVAPFTLMDPSCFRPGGPNFLNSDAYTRDFIETRDYGRADSNFRSPEQTDIVYFWSENTYPQWNRNLISLAMRARLSVRETARFFALVHTSAADSVIVGFNAKYFFRSWRPRVAIPRADTDGNPDTDPDPSWTPFLTVNHPEYPSGHAFYTGAILEAVARYFGTSHFPVTLSGNKTAVPQLIQTERKYPNLEAVNREVADARVWAGLHWRHSMRDGKHIGHDVADRVFQNYFKPVH